MDKVNLDEAFETIEEYWKPKVAGQLNGQDVRLAKLKGEFIWHSHEKEDELFLVVRGALQIQLRNGNVDLQEGEFFIVPRGVEHRPFAEREAHVLLFEPSATLSAGNRESDWKARNPERM